MSRAENSPRSAIPPRLIGEAKAIVLSRLLDQEFDR